MTAIGRDREAPFRWVLVGDGESPHLLKWARALAQVPGLEVWAASSRGFLPGFDAVVPPSRRLELATRPRVEGGNVSVLRQLPRLGAWLRSLDAQVLHAHYLTSHGTLVWLARGLWRLPGRMVASAWGSDVLVAPRRSLAVRWVTRRVLRACDWATSDSRHMAERMCELGAREVEVFPFGLDGLPPRAAPPGGRPAKQPWLVFANRALEPLYRPERVLQYFALLAHGHPQALLVVANDGSLRASIEEKARRLGLAERVRFTGRLRPDEQERWYRLAQWYLSLPASDSVSVSVIEAMAHGCIPVLSDLPANRELVEDGVNGLIVPEGAMNPPIALAEWIDRAEEVATRNRRWVEAHALFPPAVRAFVDRVRQGVTPPHAAARHADRQADGSRHT